MFSRRGFIAGVLASLAHLVVSRTQKPEPTAGQPWNDGEAKAIGGGFEITDSFWYPGEPGESMADGIRFTTIAHAMKNMRLEYRQNVTRTGKYYVAEEPAKVVGHVERYCVTHYHDGDQMCDLLTVRNPTPLVVVIPVQRTGLCEIHTVIRMTNVEFFQPGGINAVSANGTPIVYFTADTVNYAMESKHVASPELCGKDARPGG